eukprot:TRINITY_DN10405_c0_g1_i1.p1 TRINITY_DN10405_c0_g1~~TRINITY_DN10405_c0_g1_i1.p1  ORF type:complete len:143 (-),score=23.48 TRINITY_DN10405_c0_g1_i1:293-721(-)
MHSKMSMHKNDVDLSKLKIYGRDDPSFMRQSIGEKDSHTRYEYEGSDSDMERPLHSESPKRKTPRYNDPISDDEILNMNKTDHKADVINEDGDELFESSKDVDMSHSKKPRKQSDKVNIFSMNEEIDDKELRKEKISRSPQK